MAGPLPDAVAAKVGQLRQNGAEWKALCPAHDDHHPSLSLRVKDDGRTLVTCRAGCDQDAVLVALERLGVDRSALMGPPDQRAAAGPEKLGPIVETYDYQEEDGTLLSQVCRHQPKAFRQRRPNPYGGWIPHLGDTRRVLFRLPELVAAREDHRPVAIAEGEKDVLALVAKGLVATCNPGGAGKWRAEFDAYFTDLEVTIYADRDTAGRDHARDVAGHLDRVARSVRVVEPPDPYKDVAEMLGADRGLDQVRDIAAEPAAAVPAGRVLSLSTGPVDPLDGIVDGAWLDAQNFPPLAYVVPGLIPEGMTLLVGPPKAGKSWAALDIALAVAAGGRAFGKLPVGPPRPVLTLALEDGDRRLQDRCRVLLQGPTPKLWHRMLRLPDPTRPVEDTIRCFLERHRGQSPLVVLDTLGKVVGPALPGESSYGRDYRVGSALKRTVDDHPGAALLVLHHDRKAGSEDFVDSVSGTHGLAGSADTVLLLARGRQETGGVLHVTGRDIPEGEYAVDLTKGASWQISGDDLVAAATEATTRRVTAGLGDRAAAIAGFVAGQTEPVKAKDVATALHLDPATTSTYLRRLLDAGRVTQPGRGLYRAADPQTPPQTPVKSVKSVRSTGQDPARSNTSNTFNAPLEGACAVCGDRLDDVHVEERLTTHPHCDPEEARA